MNVEVSNVGNYFEVWFQPHQGSAAHKIGEGLSFAEAVLDATRTLVGALCTLGEMQDDNEED